MSVFSDLKKAVKRIGRVERDVKSAFSKIDQAFHRMDRIDWGWNNMGQQIRSDLGKRFDDFPELIERESEKAARRVFEEMREDVEDIVEDALEFAEDVKAEALADFRENITDEVIGGIASALDDAADIIEIMAPSNFTLVFGAEVALIVQCEITVSVTIPNPVGRLTEIRKWADNAPKGRAQIIECIKDFGPESLSVEAKVSGNGFSAGWDGEDKYDRIDAFLEKHGVK